TPATRTESTTGRTDAGRQGERRPRRGTHPGSTLPLLDPSDRGPTPASRLRWIACGRRARRPGAFDLAPPPPAARPHSPPVPPPPPALLPRRVGPTPRPPAGAPFFSVLHKPGAPATGRLQRPVAGAPGLCQIRRRTEGGRKPNISVGSFFRLPLFAFPEGTMD